MIGSGKSINFPPFARSGNFHRGPLVCSATHICKRRWNGAAGAIGEFILLQSPLLRVTIQGYNIHQVPTAESEFHSHQGHCVATEWGPSHVAHPGGSEQLLAGTWNGILKSLRSQTFISPAAVRQPAILFPFPSPSGQVPPFLTSLPSTSRPSCNSNSSLF